MTTTKSNEVLQANIEAIQSDIKEIKQKLDTKYVSHETFQLTIQAMEKRVSIEKAEIDEKFNFALKMAIAFISPLYVASIGLIVKMFTA